MPSADSAVEVEHAAERTIIGVHAPDVRAMLRWIAPALLRQIGEESLGSRGIEGRRARRGASIILTSAPSSSGPHKDESDTLLFNVSGTRRVWFAPPAAVSDGVPRLQERSGQPVFLPPACDPACQAVPPERVKWAKPVELNAGDAIWIQEGWWHCIGSEAQGVAVAVEVKRGSLRGNAPRVLERVGSRKASGRASRMVSRRPGWGSAACVLNLWVTALPLAACDCG